MAQSLPADASEDAITEELAFLDVLIESLDPGADDYNSRLAELEDQKAGYENRLEVMNNGSEEDLGGGNADMGLDGSSDFWRKSVGGPAGSARQVSEGRPGTHSAQHNGLKRSLNSAHKEYPSKRPTPDPSNAGTPTSSTGSFEWVEHPQRPTQPSQSQFSSRERNLQRQRQAEAAMKRKREEERANEAIARKLEQSQFQPQFGSSASSSRPSYQTTLDHSGSLSRPNPPPTPVLTPSQEQQLRKSVQSHGHPTANVKAEPGSSKQQFYSSPLTNRTKAATTIVDLTGSDSDSDDDAPAEIEPGAFSPSNRRHLPPPPGITFQNRAPFDPNNMSTFSARPRAPAARAVRQSMPGAWPEAMQIPSSDNGYVYNHARPDWLQNTNEVTARPAIPTPYNGARAIGGDLDDRVAELDRLLNGSGPRNMLTPSNAIGSSSRVVNPYGRPPTTSDVYGGPAYSGTGYGALPGRINIDDDEDDDIIFGGSRPVVRGQPFGYGQSQLPGGIPADYANQEAYRQRFDEIMNQNPARTMEEINALMENIRPDEEMDEKDRVKTPPQMSVSLHKYQELGLTWLQRCEDGSHKGGILADDMGLGKTIQMLSLIVTHKSDDPRCKTTLIVAPVALMRQWKQEIESKIRPGYRLSVEIHHGASRKKSFSNLRHFDVVLTTFGTLTAELKKLEAFALRKRMDPTARPRPKEQCALLGDDAKWYRVILDEAQCIKNNNTQGAKAACRLNTRFRFCVTGTPMMNNVDELWSLIHFLRIKPYCDRHQFQRDFSKRLKAEYSRDDAMKHLQALIRSIMLRRTKQSKFEGKPILELPERSTFDDHPVFSQDEQDFYKALEDRSQLQFNKYLRNGTVGSSYSAILVLLLRLRQACCHPHLIKDFGVSAAAGVSPDTLIDLAKKLTPDVVERIKSTNGNFECPVCYDAVTNPAIFVPCGHDTCQECFAKIADTAARNGEGGGAAGNAKCPNCRGEINSKKITDFESFKKVHMPDQLTEEEQAELQKMQEEFEDAQTESGDGETDSEDEDDKDEVNSNGDLDDFVVADDMEDSETASEAGEEVKAEDDDDNCHDAPTSDEVAKKGKSKGKGKEKGEQAKTGRKTNKANKSNKAKGKKKEKQKKTKGKPTQTLAELKKMATRSAAGRKAYIKKLNEDWVTSAKIEKTMERLKEIMENPQGEKVLIFSQWTSLLDLLECPISREKWGYRRYDGSMNAGMRADAVDDFREPAKDVRIMLVSLKAGNAGLNLNMASQVIILDPFWNP